MRKSKAETQTAAKSSRRIGDPAGVQRHAAEHARLALLARIACIESKPGDRGYAQYDVRCRTYSRMAAYFYRRARTLMGVPDAP